MQKRDGADSGKLMNDTAGAEQGLIVNLGIPSKQNVILKRYVVPQTGVVSQMRTRHQKIIGSDEGVRSFFGTSVNGAKFVDDIIFTDLHARIGGRIKAQILRERTDHGSVSDPIIFPNLNGSDNDSTALNLRTRGNLNRAFDKGIGPNDDIRVDPSFRINNSSAMNQPQCRHDRSPIR